MGHWCCQVEVPEGLEFVKLEVRSFYNHTNVTDFIPCGYAFLVEDQKFSFRTSYLSNFSEAMVQAAINWAIKNDTYELAANKTSCICGGNTTLVPIAGEGSDYRCNYEGNPCLSLGCQGIGVGLTVLIVGTSWLYLCNTKWKLMKFKGKFFEENGGFMLQQELSMRQGREGDTAKIFSQEELEKATDKFDDAAVIGKGGYGTIYKGVLQDGSVVAIKKSKLVDQSQTQQFVNEVLVLSQICHRNVVKLLGCCLETEVPLLVYDFVNSGTLFDHIHCYERYKLGPLSWELRLKIAAETADVLFYLHSSASTWIIHRDIKSTRPSMREVARLLGGMSKVTKVEQHPREPTNEDEQTARLVGQTCSSLMVFMIA